MKIAKNQLYFILLVLIEIIVCSLWLNRYGFDFIIVGFILIFCVHNYFTYHAIIAENKRKKKRVRR